MSLLYRAIGKSMLARYAVYAVNMLSLMVLTRVFTPSIFGIVAAVQTVVLLLQLIAEGGLSPAVIGLNVLDARDRDGIFGLSILMGATLSAALYILGPAFVDFYGMAGIRDVMPDMTATLFFNTAAVFPLAQLQRDQRFLQIGKAGSFSELFGLATALAATRALDPLSAYALYFPAKSAATGFLYWIYSQSTEFGRPMPGAKFSAISPLLRTTAYQLGFNIVNFFSRNLDSILVGRYMGATPLGIYNRSYQLMRYPLLLLGFAMYPAIQPVLRSHAGDPEFIRKLHLDLVFKLSLLGIAVTLVIYFFAKSIVLIAFGSQWSSAIPIIKLLALSIPVQVVYVTQGSIFQTFKRTDLLFGCGLFSALVNSTAIIFGVLSGSLESICWALLISFNINFVQTYYVMHKYLFKSGYAIFMLKMLPMFLVTISLALFHLESS